jgi:hypothetical protein
MPVSPLEKGGSRGILKPAAPDFDEAVIAAVSLTRGIAER